METKTVIEVKEIAPTPARRQFADCMNEWLDTLLEINKTVTVEQAMLVTRLGFLGQRLIYEANVLGMNEGLKVMKEARQ